MMRETKVVILAIVSTSIALGATGFSTTKPPRFEHRVHLEAGGDCATCHVSGKDKAPPTLNRETCAECHDETPAYDFPRGGTSLSIPFQHEKHADAFECKDCHSKVLKDRRRKVSSMSHQRCVDCHEESGVTISPKKCSPCHGLPKKQIKPKNHGKDMAKRHGKEAKWKLSTGHAGDCYTCHRKTDCTQCHMSRRPRDHNGLWKVRMHGISATWNRERCRTCHQTGVCSSCHRRTKPISHKGLWRSLHGMKVKSRTDARCGVCHASSWCVQCHVER